MNCKSCNKEIPDDSVLCPYCGTSILRGIINKQRLNVNRALTYPQSEIGNTYTKFMEFLDNGAKGPLPKNVRKIDWNIEKEQIIEINNKKPKKKFKNIYMIMASVTLLIALLLMLAQL